MNIFYCCILIGMVIFLTACVDSKQDIINYVNTVKKNAPGAVEPLPANRQFASVEYTAVKLRNPFVSASNETEVVHIEEQGNAPAEINKVIVQAGRPDADRPREYLEQFPLNAMAMVGTLSKPNVNWGLVRDGNGMVHAVKIGDYIGENSGKIIAITPDQIRIIETVPNGSGGWKQSRAIISLIKSAVPGNVLPATSSGTAVPGNNAAAPAVTGASANAPRSGSSTEAIGGISGGAINTGGKNAN